MKKEEIIIFKVENKTKINEIIKKSAKYSFLSLPFTINRMNYYNNDKQILIRINNIFKGKLAESLFFEFCKSNNIKINLSECRTPYYQIDKRDFIYNEYECDLKNNFYWDIGNFSDFIKLPALIPNRHLNDQWEKCKKSYLNKKVCIIFTFIKHGEIKNNKRKNFFPQIKLNQANLNLLKEKINKYQGLPLKNEPDDMKILIKNFDFDIIPNYPSKLEIIITAYATEEHFNLFKNVNGLTVEKIYIMKPWKNWYEQTNNGAKFLKGVIFTKIVNATCPISLLPSCKLLFSL